MPGREGEIDAFDIDYKSSIVNIQGPRRGWGWGGFSPPLLYSKKKK